MIKPGDIVKMRGTRDHGFRIIDHIEEHKFGNKIVCRQLAVTDMKYVNPTQKVAYKWNQSVIDRKTKKPFVIELAFVETNVMTEHMPNKVKDIMKDGKFVKYIPNKH